MNEPSRTLNVTKAASSRRQRNEPSVAPRRATLLTCPRPKPTSLSPPTMGKKLNSRFPPARAPPPDSANAVVASAPVHAISAVNTRSCMAESSLCYAATTAGLMPPSFTYHLDLEIPPPPVGTRARAELPAASRLEIRQPQRRRRRQFRLRTRSTASPRGD